jgi:two-component system, NarL family, sensor histidine kinase DevS
MAQATSEDRLDEPRLRGLLRAGRALVQQLELSSVLDEVLQAARELTGARYAALGVLDERREALAEFHTSGIDEQTHRAIGDLPRGRGVLGLLIEDPQPLRLTDVMEHPRSYGFPTSHPPMRSFLGVPVLIRGEAWGNLYLTEKESGDFDEADEQVVTVLAEWAAIAIANARLYENVEARRTELEAAVTRLEATSAIARAVGGETQLERVLELIVKRGRALLDARLMFIMLVDGEDLVVEAAAGGSRTEALGARVAIRGSTSGEVLRSGRSRVVKDVAEMAVPVEEWGVEGAHSAVLVPMLFRAQALGVLIAFDRLAGPHEYGRDDESLLEGFAVSAATAVANTRSVEEARLRETLQAQEQERRRWARELHDETLQGLAALQMLLVAAQRKGDPEAADAALQQAAEQVGQEIESLRTLITELRPAALDDYGLRPAIETLSERMAAVNGLAIDTRLDLGETERLDPDLETTAYRVIQEALTNVAKHARAEHVSVVVTRHGGWLELVVSDDGIGFTEHTAGKGFGLVGMGERVALVGGALEVGSSPTGTRVQARLPI